MLSSCRISRDGGDEQTSMRTLHCTYELAIKRVDTFFRHCSSSYEKHFSRWVNQEQLLSYAVASSDPPVAHAVAKWILDGGLPSDGTTFHSSTHGVQVDLSAFMARVTKTAQREVLERENFDQRKHRRSALLLTRMSASTYTFVAASARMFCCRMSL